MSKYSTEYIRQRMGAEATTAEATKVVAALDRANIDLANVPDDEWFALIANVLSEDPVEDTSTRGAKGGPHEGATWVRGQGWTR